MRYFEDNENVVYAYDTDQQELITTAINSGWVEVSQPPEPTPDPVTTMSSLTFLDRFTTTEQDAVISSSVLDVKKIYGRMMGADYIDTTDAQTIAGVDGLIAYGLVDSSRKPELLAPVS